MSNTKTLKAAYMRKWRASKGDAYRLSHNAFCKDWRKRNTTSVKKSKKQSRVKLRLEILDFFGGKCCRCQFDDCRALQIDHKNGGGNRDITMRQQCNGRLGGVNMNGFRKFIRESPDKANELFQCLCANCNWIKRFENNEHANVGFSEP